MARTVGHAFGSFLPSTQVTCTNVVSVACCIDAGTGQILFWIIERMHLAVLQIIC